MEILYLVIGLLIGGLLAWFALRSKFLSENQQTGGLLLAEQEKVKALDLRLIEQKKELESERNKAAALANNLSATEADYRNLEEKLKERKKEVEELQNQFAFQFKNLANEIFEEKSKKFTEQNKTNLSEILNPLKEKITDFEKKVEQTNKESIDRNSALREQLVNLKELNQQITKEASNLSKALKGDSKTQGTWGEIQLEAILERAGLQKDIHYFKEKNFKNEEGQNQRLDYIIKLPDDKYLVLDSKVSLTAYSEYYNTSDETEQSKFLKSHLDSVYSHIKLLSEKNYQNLYEINQPDYVMMFLANEPALTLALREDNSLYEKALDKNIALVSATTLLATLRTIGYIWKQDMQNKNALEIARQAGSLYDKFHMLIEDLTKVGNNLKSTQNSYQDAMNKLIEGKDNLVRKTERLKELGAKTTKQLSQQLLDRAD
ncbi:DNA recombination protein RmuC [Chryseotalea sanaruensis]|uniref:DNA recombination protein RmuC n=1 Tax=Chryseotalea sanaruensis TaxID=2482724 RepID=A0A401UAN1_9BACT|nr:DNA recombination protein RmuC [Chryseotalea sanaruensis]GCC51949.1 DNA recombination protein RmuC [Chryseotalea sanaruensis]